LLALVYIYREGEREREKEGDLKLMCEKNVNVKEGERRE
jgi:hypothetical protein